MILEQRKWLATPLPLLKKCGIIFAPIREVWELFISTMHNNDKVDTETGKPKIILYYSQTKEAVDVVGKMCHAYSVQEKTKRRTLAFLMNLINLGGLNLFILNIHEFPVWNEEIGYQRRQFWEDLGLELVQPLIKKRAISTVELQRAIQNALLPCDINPAAEINEHEEERKPKSKQRCYYCNSDRKALQTFKCQKTVCGAYSTKSVSFFCPRKCEMLN